MNLIDDIKIYLPKHLSAESTKELINNLNSFPENIDQRLYSNSLENEEIIFQGDAFEDLLIVNLPDIDIKKVASIVLSNTCDISSENKRNFPSRMVYAPIVNFKKYISTIEQKYSTKKLSDHLKSLKKQHITQIFYLPGIDGRLEESIVFLDRVFNLPTNYIKPNEVVKKRIFSLSDYGIYLFLFKMSIHFTRMQDKIDRGTGREIIT